MLPQTTTTRKHGTHASARRGWRGRLRIWGDRARGKAVFDAFRGAERLWRPGVAAARMRVLVAKAVSSPVVEDRRRLQVKDVGCSPYNVACKMLFDKYIRLAKAAKRALQDFLFICKTLQNPSVSFQNFAKLFKTFRDFCKTFHDPARTAGKFPRIRKIFPKKLDTSGPPPESLGSPSRSSLPGKASVTGGGAPAPPPRSPPLPLRSRSSAARVPPGNRGITLPDGPLPA